MREIRAEILLAAYNGERFLREQLDSILAQRDSRWHLTASDDGSTDATADILLEYATRYPEQITVLRRNTHTGCACRHFAALLDDCPAEYILFCDQDDVWLPDKLGSTLDALSALEATHGKDCPALVFCDLTVVDSRLELLASSLSRAQNLEMARFDFRSLLFQNAVTGCATGINRALADAALHCKDWSRVIMHDGWLAAVGACLGHIAYIDKPLILYRQHGANTIGAKDVRRMGYIAKRLAHLRALSQGIRRKKQQAAVFAESFEDCLSSEDVVFLQTFSKPRSGIRFYAQNRQLFRDWPHLLGFMLLG